jgi:peptidoglycan DL-endopeptidase CwlO
VLRHARASVATSTAASIVASSPTSSTTRRSARRLTAIAAAVALTVPLGATAHADPKQSLVRVKHDIASTRHRLAALQAKAETAAEHYNEGLIRLADAKRVAAERQQAAAAAQQRLRAVRNQVSMFALQLYKGGDPTALALVDAAQDPQTFVDRAAYSDQLSQEKAAALAEVKTAEHDAAVTAEAAKQALAAQQRIVASLAAAKKQVDDAARESQQLLAQLQRKQRQLVHEIRLEAERARRAAARAAARRAAARAAAEAAALAREQAAAAAAQQSFDSQPGSPPAPTPGPGSGNAASVAVQWARNELGKPYVWAAGGPNAFDCSGLTMYVYAKAGVYLPHSAAGQYGMGRHVSSSALRPGDLVFFGSPIHHVGIYIGGGEMIEAPHTGAVVRISPYARPDYVGATRVVG